MLKCYNNYIKIRLTDSPVRQDIISGNTMKTDILNLRAVHSQNNTVLLQVVNFTGLLQLVNKLQQACQFHQVVTSLLKLTSLIQLNTTC